MFSIKEGVDISQGGLTCRCLENCDDFNSSTIEIDLLHSEQGCSIHGLTGRILRSSRASEASDSSKFIINFSVEFADLTDEKLDELEQFIFENCQTQISDYEKIEITTEFVE